MAGPRHVYLNGWRLPVSIGTNAEKPEKIGRIDDTFLGQPQRSQRALPMVWEGKTIALTREKADTLEGLFEGLGHVFPFDRDAFSAAGLGPDAGATYVITARSTSAGVHGIGYLDVTAGSIVWDTRLPDEWTVMYWRSVAGTRAHVVVRSDELKWLDGASASPTTTELTVSNGAVALGVGQYDDLVVLPFVASSAFIEAFWRWTTCKDICFRVPFDAEHAEDVLHRGTVLSSMTGTFDRGQIGRAGKFITTQLAGYTGNLHALNGQTEASWEMWFRRDSTLAHSATGYLLIRSTGSSGYLINIDDTTKAITARVYASGANPETTTADDVVVDDTWHHLVITWTQASGRVSIYLDGTLLTAASETVNAGAAPDNDSGLTTVIANTTSGTSGFGGEVDEVRMYRKALAANEVQDHYQAGRRNLPPPVPTPFSPLPRLHLWGGMTQWKLERALAEVAEEPQVQLGDSANAAWLNNSRNVAFRLDQVQAGQRDIIPEPWAQYFLEERLQNGTSIRPVRGLSLGNGAKQGSPAFEPGPLFFGRCLYFASAGQRVDVQTDLVKAIGGTRAVTVCAWVKRAATGAQHTVLDLAVNGIPDSKLRLDVTSGNLVRVVARPDTAEAEDSDSSVFTLTDTTGWHLVGAIVDVANDKTILFMDDDQWEETTTTVTATAFTQEAGTAHRIGDDRSAGNRWNGRIASVALWRRSLARGEVRDIYRLGRRGVFR